MASNSSNKAAAPIMGKLSDAPMMENVTTDSLMARFQATFKGRSADKVAQAIQDLAPISRDVRHEMHQQASLGARAADKVAAIGGSWGFVIGFGLFLAIWAAINLLMPVEKRFDPYPFIFLNLLLSTLAAIQAPIIMMSQNRQAEKDRAESHHDYEINLKAELEIMLLHEKLDALAQQHQRVLAKLDAMAANERDLAP